MKEAAKEEEERRRRRRRSGNKVGPVKGKRNEKGAKHLVV